MSKLLARKLQRFYTRVGNKIVFANGLSLNQFGWEMWEKLGFRDIDPSVLSRVLKGDRLFTQIQLAAFCEILNVTFRDYLDLKNAIRNEILARYDLSEKLLIDENLLLFLLDKDCETVSLATSGGVPSVAKRTAELSLDLIDYFLQNFKNEMVLKEIYLRKAKILTEYVDSLFGNVNEDLLFTTAKPHIEELKKIGELLKDEAMIRNSHTLFASLYSLTNKHEFTEDFVVKGLRGQMEEFETITALKCAVVSSAATGKSSALDNYIKILKEKSESISDSFKCVAFYSLATAYSRKRDLANADLYVKLAWDVYRKLEAGNNYKITRRLGIAKTELIIGAANKSFRDKKYLEKLAYSSIDIAEASGYLRVKEQYEGYLNKILG